MQNSVKKKYVDPLQCYKIYNVLLFFFKFLNFHLVFLSTYINYTILKKNIVEYESFLINFEFHSLRNSEVKNLHRPCQETCVIAPGVHAHTHTHIQVVITCF